jgi:hypothetical protein
MDVASHIAELVCHPAFHNLPYILKVCLLIGKELPAVPPMCI